MSRRDRPAADTRRTEWSRRDKDAKASGPSLIAIVIPAALALFASAVYFAALAAPGGFPMALAGLEASRLNANDKLGPAARGPGWNTLYAQLRAETSGLPTWKPHLALREMFIVLEAVEQGRRDPAYAAEIAREALNTDPANLATRLAYAVVLDRPGTTTQPAPSPETRFEAIRGIVEGSAPAVTSTLYNVPIDRAWFAIVSSNLRRSDTVLALAKFAEHYETTQHYAGLPIVTRRMSALADELAESGRGEEAAQCRAWLVRMLVGIMDTESDAGTLLLCADLLAQTLDTSRPDLARSMRALRDEYHANASEAPSNMIDPSRAPAIEPDSYRARMSALSASAVFAACAIGAGLLFVAAILMLPVQAAWRAARSGTRDLTAAFALPHRRGAVARLLMCITGPVILAVVLSARISAEGVFSEYWLYVAFLCTCFSGAMFTALNCLDAARVVLSPDAAGAARQAAKGDRAAVILALAVSLIAILAPPAIVARTARQLDLVAPLLIVLPIVFITWAIYCVWRLRTRLRMLALLASVTWALNIFLALGALGWMMSRDADRRPARIDDPTKELDTRLGADWKDTYLAPIRFAYDRGAQ